MFYLNSKSSSSKVQVHGKLMKIVNLHVGSITSDSIIDKTGQLQIVLKYILRLQ